MCGPNQTIKEQYDYLQKHKVIRLTESIDKDSAADLKRLLDKAHELKIIELTLEIASPGGQALDAGRMFDHISNFPGTITGLVRPYACSAAAYLLQACHVRSAIENSQLHFHNVRGVALSARNFQQDLDESTQCERNFVITTVKRSKLTDKRFENLRRLDIPIFPWQALHFGLIDKIIVAKGKNIKLSPKSQTHDFDLHSGSDYDLKRFLGFLNEMRDQGFPPIRIHIKSGVVNRDMILMFYELLKQYPGHVTTIGLEDLKNHSTLLLLAGDTRKMLYNAKFRIDEISIRWFSLQLPDLKSTLGMKIIKGQLTYLDEYIFHEYLSRSKITPKEYRQMLNKNESYSSQTALRLGIIDGIIIPKHLKIKK